MNNIGNLIREYREAKSLTRKDLASGICSEKYVYMIERGERNPSADLIKLFGNRLGVDLFDYYDYLSCNDPIEVEKIMRKINKAKAKGDFKELIKIADQASNHNDFKKKPWRYEVELAYLAHKVLCEGKYKEGIVEIKKNLLEMDKRFLDDVIGANYYLLLSTSYQMASDYDQASKVILILEKALKGKERMLAFSQVIVGSKINTVTLKYHLKEYEEMLDLALLLQDFQLEHGIYDQVLHTYFYLSFAYLRNGQSEESIEYFKKGLYVSIISPKPLDVYYIRSFPIFSELLSDKSIPQDLRKRFLKIYDRERPLD